MSVPTLRFKDEDRKDYPEWSTNTLEEISTKYYQGINTAADSVDYVDEGFPIIQAKHITNEYLDFSDARKLSLTDYEKYKNKYNPKINDLLISNIGTLGKVVLIEKNIDFLIAWNIFKVTLNPEKCNPIFIKEFLKKIAFGGYFDSIKTGNATKFINKTDLLAIEIDAPSISEQTKIANFLTAVDEKISQLTQKCELLTQYKKGMMQQIFSQALRFKDDDGREFPEWEVRQLSDIGEIVTGKTPSTADENLWKGDIQFVTPTDITEQKYQYKTQRTVASHPRLKVLPKHSIMFTCIASIGKMSLSVKPCITNQQINALVPQVAFEREYIYYALLSIVDFIKSTQANTTLPIINKTEFSKFTIPIPVRAEQIKIANFLIALDDKITNTQAQLAAAKQYKQGLLQQMFV